MKIYRYIYKNNEISLNEFECEHTENGFMSYYTISKTNIRIYDYDLDNIKYSNYIMYSLDPNKMKEFIDYILEKKEMTLRKKVLEADCLKQEMEKLRNVSKNQR